MGTANFTIPLKEYVKDINTRRCFTIGSVTAYANFGMIQRLIEWHFDVFGLIEKGLAVNYKIIKNKNYTGK